MPGKRAPAGSTLAQKLAFYSMPGPGGCRIWKSHQDPDKAAFMRWKGRVHLASRLAWEDENGPIPKGAVLHPTCSHVGCIRVKHWKLGKPNDESHSRTVLTAQQVREMRSIPRFHRPPLAELAKKYGVTETMISYALNRKRWKNV